MAQKRTHEEAFEVPSLDSVEKPISSANIHGIITSLSPVKKGRNRHYFDATLHDGISKLRLVGFNSKQEATMSDHMQNKELVQLNDCQIKPARRGHDMEVLLTTIHGSPKKISVPSIEFEDNTPVTIQLQQLQQKTIYDTVTVNVKVISILEPELVPPGKRKQHITISDSSSTATLILWEEHINTLSANTCYTLKSFVVREYNCSKNFAMSLRGSQIIPIEDIGHVCTLTEDDKSTEIYNATIIGVNDIESHKTCLRCNARVEPTTSSLGRCTKQDCHMLQRYDMCTTYLSTKITLMSASKTASKIYSLIAYGKTIKELAGSDSDEVKEENLMEIPQLKTITFNDKNVITSFTK